MRKETLALITACGITMLWFAATPAGLAAS